MRGLAGIRAADYAQTGTFGDYIKKANEETLVVIHIETGDAIDELPKIVDIDGIDVIFIGPTDLSHSLGLAGQVQHPTVQTAIQRIVDIVTKSNKTLGIMVGNAAAAKQWRERGARYITIGLESVLAPAMKDYLTAVRG